MLSHEIPQKMVRLIALAMDDVFASSNDPLWDPVNLPEPLRVVWAIEKGQGVIDNGGLGYFFENDWPDKPPYSLFVDAFKAVGATEAADCLAEAVRCFPFPDPHLDFEARRTHMNKTQEASADGYDIFDKLGSRIMDLGGDTSLKLAAYIESNRAHFPSVPPKGVVDTETVHTIVNSDQDQRVVFHKYIIGREGFRIDLERQTENGWEWHDSWGTNHPDSLPLTIKWAEYCVPWLKDHQLKNTTTEQNADSGNPHS